MGKTWCELFGEASHISYCLGYITISVVLCTFFGIRKTFLNILKKQNPFATSPKFLCQVWIADIFPAAEF